MTTLIFMSLDMGLMDLMPMPLIITLETLLLKNLRAKCKVVINNINIDAKLREDINNF